MITIIRDDWRFHTDRLSEADAVIFDPPYPEIDRDYGRWSVEAWNDMMHAFVLMLKGKLKPTASAMILLQPNAEFPGKMRPWFYEFMAWCSRVYNVVQDLWWWNTVALPSGGAGTHGLCRGTLKAILWLGPSDCYRNQNAVLWSESEDQAKARAELRAKGKTEDVHTSPSGYTRNRLKVHEAAEKRGGVTPFNVWPIPNSGQRSSLPGATPIKLARKLIDYICPPGGTVFDPFGGGFNIGVAAFDAGRHYIATERHLKMFEIGRQNLTKNEVPFVEVIGRQPVAESAA